MIKFFFKALVLNTAKSAVLYAENVLHGQKGEHKKKVAIAYIMEKLPIWRPIKAIVYRFLAELIDESIEQALIKLKSI